MKLAGFGYSIVLYALLVLFFSFAKTLLPVRLSRFKCSCNEQMMKPAFHLKVTHARQ